MKWGCKIYHYTAEKWVGGKVGRPENEGDFVYDTITIQSMLGNGDDTVGSARLPLWKLYFFTIHWKYSHL